MKRLFRRASYTFFLCAVAVGTLEIFGPRIMPELKDWYEFMADPDHRMKPHEAPDLNDDGVRSDRASTEFLEENFNVIFLGDSFTYGMFLKSQQAIPAKFEKIAAKRLERNDIKAVNFGWISSSPLLSYRLLKDIGKKYKPDLVVLVLDMSDFYDDLLYENILKKKRAFFLANYLPVTTALVHYAIRYHLRSDTLSRLFSGLPAQRYFVNEYEISQTKWAVDNTFSIIGDINSYAGEVLQAEFVLVVLPRYYQYNVNESKNDWSHNLYKEPELIPPPYADQPFLYIKEKSFPYPVISLLEDFRGTDVFPTCFDQDPHFNAQGSALAAQFIFQHCQSIGCFESR